jgi:hypothetical protein
MARSDRTLIAPMLIEHFPTMTEKTSDEWQGFLNAMTGLSIDLDEDNSTAFDKWRQALTTLGKASVWGISPEKIEQIRKRGEELKRKEEERVQTLPETLSFLSAAAPTKTAQQLIDDTKRAAKG